ncbi:hypothetical protein [Plantibacter sp. CFBP 8775]|uniref:hypothetical protein n=1 Tax=Plantibacter sp. CFBP 8775 TaxID=2774038 RepID=UPI001786FFC6|nr:hypothetical protein [Plantibacter sp. CFBP 8775]MBD8104768.1 hypothetical protein [Plantibacter sp. CFBP 8775]
MTAVVAEGGERFATAASGTVTIRDADGVQVTSQEVGATPILLAGRVDGSAALLAVAGARLLVWSGDMTVAAVWDIPTDARVSVLGDGVVVSGADGQVFVVTNSGLAPFTTPRVGAAPLAVTSDGALQWASARGEVLTAAAVGTVLRQTAMAQPSAGATVSRWLSGGSTILLVWTLPDGTATLATHADVDGSLLASTAVDATTAEGRLVLSDSRTTAMLGDCRVDLATGLLDVPAEGFSAATALGESFFGSMGADAAVLDGANVAVAKHAPTFTPLGVTSAGKLLATSLGSLSIFPKAPAH